MHRGEMWCSFPRISDRKIQGNIPDPCVVLLHYPDIHFMILFQLPSRLGEVEVKWQLGGLGPV